MAEKLSTVSNTDLETLRRRQKIVSITIKVVTYVFLVVFALIVLFPFYWMIISSLKTE